jgi:hypothetical protein
MHLFPIIFATKSPCSQCHLGRFRGKSVEPVTHPPPLHTALSFSEGVLFLSLITTHFLLQTSYREQWKWKKSLWQEALYYEGESNENRKTEIKIRNIAPLSYKLADMLPML